MTDKAGTMDLRYPLYLDVPMMISFLAAIEDGVTYEENVHRKAGGQRRIDGETSGGLGLPSLLGVLPFDLRGRLTGATSTEESEELQLVKRHTEASLFNRLRTTLHDLDVIERLNPEQQIEEDIGPGEIIEVSGTVARNSLDELITLAERIRPFIEQTASMQSANQQHTPKEVHQSRRQSQGSHKAANKQSQSTTKRSTEPQQLDLMTIIGWIREDLDASDMTDVVLQTGDLVFPTCVLTLSKDFGTGRTIDSLLGATVTVLGKVSAVVRDEPVSLLRRSVLSYMPKDQSAQMFGGLRANPGLDVMAGQVEVQPPLLQILPLAIFV